MKVRIYYDSDNRVVNAITGPDEIIAAQPTIKGCFDSYLELDMLPQIGHFWLPDGTFGPIITLEQDKDEKWRQIKQKRTEREFGTFIYDGKELDGDIDAQRRLNGYISISKSALAQGMPFQAEFTLANNEQTIFTAMDFVNIELAKAASVAEAFGIAVGLRQAIAEATSKEELDAISWPL